jgi:thiosulfate reductase cytochrome b subunit
VDGNRSESEETKLAVMAERINYIKDKVDKIEEKLEKDYVTRQEFDPVKRLVYGFVVLALTAVMIALIKLVVIK